MPTKITVDAQQIQAIHDYLSLDAFKNLANKFPDSYFKFTRAKYYDFCVDPSNPEITPAANRRLNIYRQDGSRQQSLACPMHPNDNGVNSCVLIINAEKKFDLHFHASKADGLFSHSVNSAFHSLNLKTTNSVNDDTAGVMKRLIHNQEYPYHDNPIYSLLPNLYIGTVVRQINQHWIKRNQYMKDVGEELFSYLFTDDLQTKRRCFSPRALEQLANAIVKALQALHEKNIVHTDVKAENICIKETVDPYNPYIATFIDFDEAFRLGIDPVSGRGTACYFPPEFFKGKRPNYNYLNTTEISTLHTLIKEDYNLLFSKASDVYSLGILLRDILNVSKVSHAYKALIPQMLAINPQARLKLETVVLPRRLDIEFDSDNLSLITDAQLPPGLRQDNWQASLGAGIPLLRETVQPHMMREYPVY